MPKKVKRRRAPAGNFLRVNRPMHSRVTKHTPQSGFVQFFMIKYFALTNRIIYFTM